MKPRPRTATEKHRWRDAGGGMVECETTKRRMLWADLWNNSDARKVELTPAEWSKLEEMAKRRKRSPEQCLRDMIGACQPEGGERFHHTQGGS